MEENNQQNQPFMNPYMQDESPVEGSLKYQLDPDELIEKIRHILLGHSKRKNARTGDDEWFEDDKRMKLINEEGINILEPILRGYLDKLFPLSDLEQVQIEQMVLNLEFYIRNLITLNFLKGNKWEIPNLATASIIKAIICDTTYATLRKAYLRGYQNFLKTIQRVSEIQSFKGNMNAYNEPTQNQNQGLKKIPLVGGLFR